MPVRSRQPATTLEAASARVDLEDALVRGVRAQTATSPHRSRSTAAPDSAAAVVAEMLRML